MVQPIPRPLRAAFVLAAAVFGLASAPSASGQILFDPYQAYNPYYNYSVPTTAGSSPMNYPGAVREAREFDANAAGYGVYNNNTSRYNTFDRYLDDYNSDVGAGRRGAADPYRGRNAYVPNRENDQKFYSEEAERAQRELVRERLYRAASRETDPVKRADLLRRLARVSAGQSDPGARADARTATGAAAGRSRGTVPAATARPGTGTVLRSDATNAPAATTPALGGNRAAPRTAPANVAPRRPAVPDERPRLPSEMNERDRPTPSAAPASPAGTGSLPAPSPIPDDLPALPAPR